MKCTVIYHRADFDGIFCREIARKFLPEAELIGWDYGDPFVPMPAEGLVYILDLSPECLDARLVEGTVWNRIVWIDHHKSAIEKFMPPKFPQINGYRIDGVAACRLAWQWFANGSEAMEGLSLQKQDFVDRRVVEPLAVRLAGEYDVWDKRDPEAELFQHGLRSQSLDGLWPYLLGENNGWHTGGWNVVTGLLQQGKAIHYARTQENESIIKGAGFTVMFEGLVFLACNHARYNSLLFTASLKPEHDGCLGFCWRGGQWSVSLYHAPGKEHHDLSKIASKYGGGGHRGACGFRTQKLPFISVN